MKPRVPAEVLRRLRDVERRLDALTDEENHTCTLDPALKRGVRLYVRSWIVPDVEALLAWAKGERTVRGTP